jgi:hypothetical protein
MSTRANASTLLRKFVVDLTHAHFRLLAKPHS